MPTAIVKFSLRIGIVFLLGVLFDIGIYLHVLPNVHAMSAGSTFSVNSQVDGADVNPGDGVCETAPGNGICSLRAAVMEGNADTSGSGTILLPSGVYSLTIGSVASNDYATGDLDILRSTTIVASDAADTIIDGSQLDRVLEIHGSPENVLVQITGVTAQNGASAEHGGGIFNHAALVLRDCAIRDNHAAQHGGGVYSHGSLAMYDVTIIGNHAEAAGGGIYSAEVDDGANTLLLESVSIENNVARLSGGGIFHEDFVPFDEAPSRIQASIIQGNRSQYAGGGGIVHSGYNDDYENPSLSIVESAVISNTATSELHSAAELANRPLFELRSLFPPGRSADNRARANDHALDGVSQFPYDGGGGILNEGYLTIRNSLIRGNRGIDGGGIYSLNSVEIHQTTIRANRAGRQGGGIENRGELTMNESTVSGNRADGIGGGGIYNDGYQLVVESSTIDNNVTAADGGGIYSMSYRDELQNSTVSSNRADGHGGGLYMTSHSNYYQAGVVYLTNVTVSENQADSDGDERGDGGGLSLAISSEFEENVYGDEEGIILKNTIVAGNRDLSSTTTYPDCWTQAPFQPIQSLGHNLIGQSAGCAYARDHSDIVDVVPLMGALLGPLQDNGGLTFTHALLEGNLAIDGGNPDGCYAESSYVPLNRDQRGFFRPADGNGDGVAICDIGAYELGASEIFSIFLPNISAY